MDLIDSLRQLATKLKVADQLRTEEATKNAFVMPFINSLGYNVFDPTEVIPEFVADVGTKKGEKVDYAIMSEGQPIILIECKRIGEPLDSNQASQLYRYFSVTKSRFGVLTDGIRYLFYSDLESPNVMDSLPFFEFNLTSFDEDAVDQLKSFMKESFDLDGILLNATDLKFTKAIRRLLGEEWINPSDELVRLFTSRVYGGKITQSVREQFALITKKALHEFVSDKINQRLKHALEGADIPAPTTRMDSARAESEPAAEEVVEKSNIVTTDDEIEGFLVVKSILREVVDVKRVFMRDTQSYCGVLLDDNNRKPICRLHFNGSKKYISTFDESKNPTRHDIDSIDDIYQHGSLITAIAQSYDNDKASEGAS
ncbi:MAG: hypothetical protein ACI9HK_004003 [Pirellulaceae bacterium]|jgi:hypothetical protein